ncbi:hypothetical protein CP061683_1321B, partial [Chlamydia psittaci 06-1683]
ARRFVIILSIVTEEKSREGPA